MRRGSDNFAEHFTRPACVLVAALFAGWVLGQAVNTRVQSGGQVNPQVNTELYGGGTSSSVRYAQMQATSVPMQSELRYQYVKSGALPSDIRMGYAAIGPLNPMGPSAYIPSGTPNYLPTPSTAPPPAMGAAAYSNASIRYSTPVAPARPMSTYVPSPMVSTPQVSSSLVSQGPINGGPINTSVRYSR